MTREELPESLALLASAMRAVGAGVATVDGVTLDLRIPPAPVPVAPGPPREPLTQEQRIAEREAMLLRSSGGKKPRLR